MTLKLKCIDFAAEFYLAALEALATLSMYCHNRSNDQFIFDFVEAIRHQLGGGVGLSVGSYRQDLSQCDIEAFVGS